MNPGKKIEHLLKRSIASLLKRLLEQPFRLPDPPYNKILFLRFDVLGDMILSIPVFKAMRHKFQESEIDVLCSEKNYILLADTKLADELYIAGKNPLRYISLIRRLRKKKYDLIINLVTRPSFTFGLLARFAGPDSVRIAADQERLSYLYNHIIDLPPKNEIHMLKRKFLLCAEFINSDISETDIPWMTYSGEVNQLTESVFNTIGQNLHLSQHSPRIVGLNLSAGLARRQWPLENYISFLQQVITRHGDVIDGWAIFTDPNQPEVAQYVSDQVHKTGVTVIPPQRDFRVIVGLVGRLYVLVSPDTSVAHAASAMGTPILDLMIGENINIWDPIGVPNRIVLSKDPFTLDQLPVEEAVDAFDELITELSM